MANSGQHQRLVLESFRFLLCFQWEFHDPKLEVPTIYKAYVREYPQQNMALHGTEPPF